MFWLGKGFRLLGFIIFYLHERCPSYRSSTAANRTASPYFEVTSYLSESLKLMSFPGNVIAVVNV